MRMDFTEIQFPSLYPLPLLVKPHRLKKGTHFDEANLLVQREPHEGGRIVVTAPRQILPSGWAIVNERSSKEAAASYEVHCQGQRSFDSLTLLPKGVRYWGWREYRHRKDTFRLGIQMAVQWQPKAGIPTVECCRYYNDCTPVQRRHQDQWVLSRWGLLVNRVTRARQLAESNVPEPMGDLTNMLLTNTTKLVKESLAELVEAVPVLACAYFTEQEPAYSIDLDALKERLRGEIPTHLHSLMEHPDRIPALTISEELGVFTVVECHGPRCEMKSARLLVKTSADPEGRPKRGFGFLKTLLGSVPPFALQNTIGQEKCFALNPDHVGDLKAESAEILDVGQAILTYGKLLRDGIAMWIKPFVKEFAGTDWDEASIVPADRH